MEFNAIPTIEDGYYNQMSLLRAQISDAVEQYKENKKKWVKKTLLKFPKKDLNIIQREYDAQNSSEVEKTLDRLLPVPVLKNFEDWEQQKTVFEESLISTFLNNIVDITMEPDRNKGQLYQYSIYSSGWCLDPSHKLKIPRPVFIGGKSVANVELYTLDELIENWEEIFFLDQKIDDNPELASAYAPTHQHDTTQVPVRGVLTATRHELRIVDTRNNHVPGTTISYARTKSGVRYLFKIAEWLTGIEADGKPRSSIDDYLAALSRVPDEYDAWVRGMQVIKRISEAGVNLENVLRLQRYSHDRAVEIRNKLEADPDLGGFVSGRSDLQFEVERTPRGGKYERRFAEILIPTDQIHAETYPNVVGWQVYHDKDYTRSEGVEEQKHTEYRDREELQTLRGFTPWHWSLMRRLEPFFVDDYIRDTFKGIYESRLNLDHLKK